MTVIWRTALTLQDGDADPLAKPLENLLLLGQPGIVPLRLQPLGQNEGLVFAVEAVAFRCTGSAEIL